MSDLKDGQVLGPSDFQSLTWLRLKKYYEDRLSLLRVRNDGDLDPIATAALRGEIRAIKNSLALATPDPAMEADEG